jgi:hypothetical protein
VNKTLETQHLHAVGILMTACCGTMVGYFKSDNADNFPKIINCGACGAKGPGLSRYIVAERILKID